MRSTILLLVAYAATAAAFTSVPGASTLAVAGRRPLFARRAAASVERRTVLTAKATTITEEEFEVMMEAKAKPILVDFYADWCGPCKLVEPFVNEMAELYPGIDVVKGWREERGHRGGDWEAEGGGPAQEAVSRGPQVIT
mmetsp:Transcript_33242/g.87882  ORF Transcript_33242/g.87882 Transcript_33242/m.87882 type:complete len:140 (-) Transcript_33242:227-646(-)